MTEKEKTTLARMLKIPLYLLSWILILSGLIGALTAPDFFTSSVIIAFAGLVLLPSKGKILTPHISLGKGVAIVVVLTVSLIAYSSNAQREEIKATYNENPEAYLNSLRAAYKAEEYNEVISKTNALLDAGDAEINQLHDQAKAEYEKLIAEANKNRVASDTEKMNAYYMCKQFIKKELHDPESLDFPRPHTAEISNEGYVYNIAGTFRAKNAFGAKIQTSYICAVKQDPNKDIWYLLELK